MTSIYKDLICDLKIKLKNKNIKFKKLFSSINNQKYDDIDEIKDDEPVQSLIKNIVDERERIGDNMEKKLNDLLWLNELLIQFGEETHSSKTQALKVLKTKVFINIYDLAAEQYKKRTTKNLLRKELKEHPERRYPLHSTKKNIILKTFLIKL